MPPVMYSRRRSRRCPRIAAQVQRELRNALSAPARPAWRASAPTGPGSPWIEGRAAPGAARCWRPGRAEALELVTLPFAARYTVAGFARSSDRPPRERSLFRATKLVRTFHVATGQSIYPTPSGRSDRRQAALPVVVPADVRLVGEGLGSSHPARAIRSGRGGWACPRSASASTGRRRRLDRILRRTAATHARVEPSGCSSASAPGRDHSQEARRPGYVSTATTPMSAAKPVKIRRWCPLVRTLCASARPSRISAAKTIPAPITNAGSRDDQGAARVEPTRAATP